MTRRPLHDDALLAAAKAASTTPQPTPSQTARRARALERAIAQHAERQRRAVPRRTVAAAALVIAGAASATTAWLTSVVTVDHDAAAAVAPAEAPRSGGQVRSLATPTTIADDAPPVVVVPLAATREATSERRTGEALARDDGATTSKTASTTASKTTGKTTVTTNAPSRTQAARAAAASTAPASTAPMSLRSAATPRADVHGADGVNVVGTVVHGADVHGADEARAVVVDVQDVVDAAASPHVDARTADSDDVREARELRDRCIDGLRSRRDRAALDDCRVFGQRFPGHPAARALAFGAGGLAEELGLPRDAIAAYSRAILLSPLVGSAWDDALLARARVYANVGALDEARADLSIYLHRAPEAAGNADVEHLRHVLQLEP
jgi:hypothetical protein